MREPSKHKKGIDVPEYLALIGFSGTGKTTWARRLSKECGYRHVCCDDLIEKKLNARVGGRQLGGIHNVARWLGHPYRPEFREREKLYSACEKEVMLEILRSHSRADVRRKPIVIDTTGSVIYVGQSILGQLRKMAKVVYLKLDERSAKMMLEQYLQVPKPVVWHGMYKRLDHETNRESLGRCFSRLMKSRMKRYDRMAHVCLDSSLFRGRARSGKTFLENVRRSP